MSITQQIDWSQSFSKFLVKQKEQQNNSEDSSLTQPVVISKLLAESLSLNQNLFDTYTNEIKSPKILTEGIDLFTSFKQKADPQEKNATKSDLLDIPDTIKASGSRVQRDIEMEVNNITERLREVPSNEEVDIYALKSTLLSLVTKYEEGLIYNLQKIVQDKSLDSDLIYEIVRELGSLDHQPSFINRNWLLRELLQDKRYWIREAAAFGLMRSNDYFALPTVNQAIETEQNKILLKIFRRLQKQLQANPRSEMAVG